MTLATRWAHILVSKNAHNLVFANILFAVQLAEMPQLIAQTWLLICEHRLYKSAMHKANLAKKSIVFKIYTDIDVNFFPTASPTRASKFKLCIVETPIAEFYLHDPEHYKYDFPYLDHDLVLDFITNKDGAEVHDRSMLHPVISQRVLSYLSGKNLDKKYTNYNCIDFVNELFFGRNVISENLVNTSCFESVHSSSTQLGTRSLSLSNLLQTILKMFSGANDDSKKYHINDGLFLTNASVTAPIHVALSIGHNLFLSKYGPSEFLLISSIEEMLKTYPAPKMVKLTPKKAILTSYSHQLKLTSMPSKLVNNIAAYLNEEDKSNLKSANKSLAFKCAM